MKKIVTILILFCLAAVVGKAQKTRVICGDERTDAYLPKLKDKTKTGAPQYAALIITHLINPPAVEINLAAINLGNRRQAMQ